MRVNLKRVCKLWVFSFYLDSLDANIQTIKLQWKEGGFVETHQIQEEEQISDK